MRYVRTVTAVLATAVLVSCDSLTGTGPGPDMPIVFTHAPTNSVLEADLFLISEDGRRREQLTALGGGALDPAWSPDGSHIAFTRATTVDSMQLWVVEVATGTARALPQDANFNRHPAWSPDGTRIVYSWREGPWHQVKDWGFAIVRLDGSPPARVPSSEPVYGVPVWSADGERLLYPLSGSVWALAPEGGSPEKASPEIGICDVPQFSPDRRRVAYPICPDFSRTVSHIVVAGLDWAEQQRIPARVSFRFGWAPDGERVVADIRPGPQDPSSIAIIDLQTGEHTTVTAGPDQQVSVYPHWRPRR